MSRMDLTTRFVHGDRHLRTDDGIAPAIVQTSGFAAGSAERFAEIATERRGHAFYTRYGNPNHAQVAAVIAAAEGAEAAMITGSGMAAITTVALALTSAGDHVVAQQSMFPGTVSLVRDLLPRFGVDCTQVEQGDVAAFARALTPKTRLVLVETPSNPRLEITDLRAVTALARDHGALTVADNTFATPVNQQPLALGADLVWHSATKYLGGHSDVSAGALAGSAELLDRIWDTAVVVGAVLGPFDAWLLLRGIRTLGLRIERHNANGLALARAVSEHRAVRRVHYPGLATHPQHDLAASQMRGYGGVLSFELDGGHAAVETFIAALEHPLRAGSLGSVESLVAHPAAMWGGTLDADGLARAGIDPALVRLAAGIEDTRDLLEDVGRALDAAAVA
jgi:methionine-gamma-lyase